MNSAGWWPRVRRLWARLRSSFSADVLLESLRKAGAYEQVAVLASRIASLRKSEDEKADALANAIASLPKVRKREQTAALVDRLPAAGMFELFLEQGGFADQFRFGREADGTPATPWGWEDLDLWLVPRPRGS